MIKYLQKTLAKLVTAAIQQTNIPVTDVSGQQTFTLPPTTQPYLTAGITVNRTGTGGSHPWLNSLTPTDTLDILFQWSSDGSTWHNISSNGLTGGTETIVKNGQTFVVPLTNFIQVGIGIIFPTGTLFRVIMTASTPLTFSGTATYQ